jgi:HEAT repeat protein
MHKTRMKDIMGKTKNRLVKTTAAVGVGCLLAFSSITPKSTSILTVPAAQAQQSKERINNLIKVFRLKRSNGNDKKIEDANIELVKIGKPAVPHLIGALKSKNDLVRKRVALVLGFIGDASAVPALVKSLEDRNADVRRWAARALGFIKDPSAIPALIISLDDEKIVNTSAFALGRIADVSAVPALINAIEKYRDNPDVRSFIPWALANIKDASAVPYLIKALGHYNRYVRGGQYKRLGLCGMIPPRIF